MFLYTCNSYSAYQLLHFPQRIIVGIFASRCSALSLTIPFSRYICLCTIDIDGTVGGRRRARRLLVAYIAAVDGEQFGVHLERLQVTGAMRIRVGVGGNVVVSLVDGGQIDVVQHGLVRQQVAVVPLVLDAHYVVCVLILFIRKYTLFSICYKLCAQIRW